MTLGLDLREMAPAISASIEPIGVSFSNSLNAASTALFGINQPLSFGAVGAKLDLPFDHGKHRARRTPLKKRFGARVGFAQHLMRCGKAAWEAHGASDISHRVSKKACRARVGTFARRIRKRAKRRGALPGCGVKLKLNLRDLTDVGVGGETVL